MNKIRKYSAFFSLLTLLAYFYIAQSNFRTKHTHFYPNGVVVTHSHPVDTKDGKPINDHHHSRSEICFFNNLQLHFYNVPDQVALPVLLPEQNVEYVVAKDDFKYQTDYLKVNPRGPPTAC